MLHRRKAQVSLWVDRRNPLPRAHKGVSISILCFDFKRLDTLYSKVWKMIAGTL